MRSTEDLTSLLLNLLIVLGLIAACAPMATPLSPTATRAPSPPREFVDVVELATRPDVAAIVIGTVAGDLGEEKGPARDIYHRWEVAVGQFGATFGGQHHAPSIPISELVTEIKRARHSE